jgi:dipeptidyl aminopeptidase/acylaminoacyl peptidase
MNVDGSDLTQLDSDAPSIAGFTDLDWSPDGTKIVLTHRDPPQQGGTEGAGEIYTVNADGSGQPTGFANPVYGYFPAWSPDGSEIVYFGYDSDLHIMNADGTEKSRVTTDGRLVEEHYPAAWSPNGTRLVFAGWQHLPDTFDIDLFTIDVDCSNRVNLTNTTDQNELQPSWQPVFPDTTAPKVDVVNPADGDQNVARGSSVTAEFSEAVQASTLNSQTVQLFAGKSTKPIKARLNMIPLTDPTSVTLTPSSKLDAKTTYTAKIKGGANGVKDLAGNVLDQNPNTPEDEDMVWSFTTGAR